jgi:uncharacterized protein with HEPN domain
LSPFKKNAYAARSTRIAQLPSDNALLRLAEVLGNIDRIRTYTEDYTFDRFVTDPKCQDAVEHCLLRISEAARKLQGVVEELIPDQPWSDIRAMGNVLRHEYDNINLSVIWHVIEHDLGPLQQAVERAIAALQDKDAK